MTEEQEVLNKIETKLGVTIERDAWGTPKSWQNLSDIFTNNQGDLSIYLSGDELRILVEYLLENLVIYEDINNDYEDYS